MSGTVTFHDGRPFWSWQLDGLVVGEFVIFYVDNTSSPVALGSIAVKFFVSEPQFKDDIMLLSNDSADDGPLALQSSGEHDRAETPGVLELETTLYAGATSVKSLILR